ncbi:hypothetical protein ACFX5U_20370 [Sphingobacterium sp. SG20118]|uniref:hypothetical protein n=1 Tax=Sphingobacterium sp. SG20118 TaxID=3367156 RepID=UPI0037DFC7D5
MKIECIFEIIDGALAAVKYANQPSNSFEYCFDLWDDVAYLEEYFEMNKNHLASNFWQMGVEDAIFKTLDEAKQFKDDILTFAEQGKGFGATGLEGAIFVSLHKDLRSNTRIQSKAYGNIKGKSLLRIYAIRLGTNQYIVTGGAIKLTKEMQAHEDTALELRKIAYVSDYLKQLGIADADDYGYLEFENKN